MAEDDDHDELDQVREDVLTDLAAVTRKVDSALSLHRKVRNVTPEDADARNLSAFGDAYIARISGVSDRTIRRARVDGVPLHDPVEAVAWAIQATGDWKLADAVLKRLGYPERHQPKPRTQAPAAEPREPEDHELEQVTAKSVLKAVTREYASTQEIAVRMGLIDADEPLHTKFGSRIRLMLNASNKVESDGNTKARKYRRIS